MKQPQNILLIQSDQHRGDWLGAAGAAHVHPPHLDALRDGECALGEPGRVWPHPVSNVDLAPTFSECTGSPPIPDADGDSLASIIAGEADASDWAERPVFSEVSIFSHLPPARMVRRGRWKYVYYHNDRETLFDLKADPTEQNNLLKAPDGPQSNRHNDMHVQLASELRALVLTEWDPELEHRKCARAWNRLRFNLQWGREIGRGQYGSLDVWPGAQAEHDA